MEQLIKNIPHAQPIPLAEQVQTEPGKVVSRTLAQQPGCGITLFAFVPVNPSAPTPLPAMP